MKRLCLLTLLAACGQHIADPWERDRVGGVRTIRVTARGDRGARERPLPFSDTGADFTLSVAVFDAADQPLTSFDGTLTLSASPGSLVSIAAPNAVGNVIRLRAGRADDVAVRVARAYGETRLWAEDTGYAPVDPRRDPAPACSDGRDNDGDGYFDYPGDVGCEAPNDDEERGGSFAAGTSEAIFFATPLLADVQGRGAQSPLVDQRVTVRGRTELTPAPEGDSAHRLVVTQTDNTGFYVTDIDDRSCEGAPCFNSMYSFNFRTPDGMRPCDLLAVLTGSVAEFVSTTQLAQPGFQVGVLWRADDPAVGRCLIPEATPLAPATVRDPALMERYESGLVRVTDVALPTLMGPGLAPQGVPMPGATNCDLNGDGRIVFAGSAEGTCANACAADPTCSEWSAWLRYGQVTVSLPVGMGEAPGRVAITPRAVSPRFDPLHPTGMRATVTGTLRQVGPNWIVQPRCEQDLVIDGDGQSVRPPHESCLHERSIGEE
ncbi:MAG: hypothetical protein U0324_01465 [Polyangiales bacterium]